MKKNHLQNLLLFLLVLAAAMGLHFLLQQIGYTVISEHLQKMGFGMGWVVLAFVPQFALLTLAWWVVIDGFAAKKFTQWIYSFFLLTAIQLVSFAWCNIGPISKSLGEPVRALLLGRYISTRDAVRSVVFLNLTLAIGTLLSFSLGALLAPLFFSLSKPALLFCLVVSGLALLIKLSIFLYLRSPKKRRKIAKNKRFRTAKFWFSWTLHQIKKFSQNQPGRFWSSVLLSCTARFAEGYVFYEAFRALHLPASLLQGVAIDVGRSLVDNTLFLVPYQIGTREFTLGYLTKLVLNGDQATGVTAALAFRIGEMSWIVVGLVLAGVFALGKKRKSISS